MNNILEVINTSIFFLCHISPFFKFESAITIQFNNNEEPIPINYFTSICFSDVAVFHWIGESE